jgi:hypothetical protein
MAWILSPTDITEKMTKGRPDVPLWKEGETNDSRLLGLGGIPHVPDENLPNDDFRAFKA